MVSKASDDLPEPESPVNTTSLSRGMATSMFLRLCSRAPRIAIVRASRGVLLDKSDMLSADLWDAVLCAGPLPARSSRWNVVRTSQFRQPPRLGAGCAVGITGLQKRPGPISHNVRGRATQLGGGLFRRGRSGWLERCWS